MAASLMWASKDGTLLRDIECDGLLWATINADARRVNEHFFLGLK